MPHDARAAEFRRGRDLAVLALFASTLFLSAALLFAVQPLVGRLVLPLLGGTPGVWNSCLVFFQSALLVGYLYVHVLTTRVRPGRQVAAHTVVLLLPLLVLPFARPEGSAEAAYRPISWLLAFLATAVAPPFFAVSTTAPLLQRWFSTTDHPAAHDPYFLYSASNVGSFVGLLAYPFVIEPNLGLAMQSNAWTSAYALLVVFILTSALVTLRGSAGPQGTASPLIRGGARAAHLSGHARAWWLVLAALPSSLMLGVTTYLTMDIAPVPLLWVVPLALYLLAFAVAFALPARAIRGFVPPALVGLTTLLIAQVTLRPLWSLGMTATLHLVTYFAVSLMCLVELAARRPPAERLTEFYAWIAVGGVLGGAFNAFVAPMAFDSLLEYPLAMAIACSVIPFAKEMFPERSRREVAVSTALGLLVAAALLLHRAIGLNSIAFVSTLVVTAVAVVGAITRPAWIGLFAALVLATSTVLAGVGSNVIAAERSFFGVYRVLAVERPPTHHLHHGTTLHGSQRFDGTFAEQPLTYFHRTGPVGEAIGALQAARAGLEVGVVGLGAGSLAAYARPTDRFTFFEIDPLVERLARSPSLFTFLDRCSLRCRVEIGDARITLTTPREAPFDLLVVDAFSSDAIPVHLLTVESLRLYLARTAGDGMIVLHISNRHLDILPVVSALARETGLDGRWRHDVVSDAEAKGGKTSSRWVVLARAGRITLGGLDGPRWKDLRGIPAGPVWNDDYSSLFSVLRPPKPAS